MKRSSTFKDNLKSRLANKGVKMGYKGPDVHPTGDRQLENQGKPTKPNSTADPEGSNNPKTNSESGEEATTH